MNDQKQLGELINGYRSTALLYIAAKLRLADRLAHGSLGAAELALNRELNEDSLQRVLRGLVAIQILSEETDGRFTLTELGRGLLASSPGSLAHLAILTGEEYLPSWSSLLHTVITGETAFDHVFQMSPWKHRSQNPELGIAFDTFLFEQTASHTRLLVEAYDFSQIQKVTDVGGGHGGLISVLLAKHSALKGVLLDLPHVIAQARQRLSGALFEDRLQIVEGDFFSRIPTGSDVYLLKSVLHDWNDDQCLNILRNCRQAMTSRDRLLIIERALPDRAGEDPDTIMLDLHMLAVLGGRERRVTEYHQLAREAGLEPCGVFTTISNFQIMEFGQYEP